MKKETETDHCKNERSHSDAVKNEIQYLHQHAPQHHHPLERQRGSFHPNSSPPFFSLCDCIMDMRDTESAQHSLLPKTFQRQTDSAHTYNFTVIQLKSNQ